MRLLSIIAMILLSFFMGCKERVPDFSSECNLPECEGYFKMWKSLFLTESGMTEEYFQKHILVQAKSIEFNENLPDFFVVSFVHSFQWLKVQNTTRMVIRLRENEDTYPYLNIPKNVFLQNEDWEKIIPFNAFYSSFTIVKPLESLPFNSIKEMHQYIRNAMLLSNLHVSDGNYLANGYLREINGLPEFHFDGTLMSNPNTCVRGIYNFEKLQSGSFQCR